MLVRVTLDIDRYWSDIEPLINTVLPYSHEEFSVEDVKQNLTDNIWNLAVVTDDDEKVIGCLIIQSMHRNNKKVAFIVIAAGRYITTTPLWIMFKAHLKSLGFDYIEGAMRDSTLRLWSKLGFRKKYSIAGVEI